MQITRDQLADSDYDILFTRDPGLFIESIIINLMWAKDPANQDQAATIARIRFVFLQWLDFYANHMNEEYAKEQAGNYQVILTSLEKSAEQVGFHRGRLHALTNLPIRKGVLTSYVDLTEVANELRKLKAAGVPAVKQ